MSCKGVLRSTQNHSGQIEDDCKKNIVGKHCYSKYSRSDDTYSQSITHAGYQDVAGDSSVSENVSSSILEIATSSNFPLSTSAEITSDIVGVSVDEWLKQRPESVTNMDLDPVMKTDGLDSNYMNDVDIGYQFLCKESVDMCIVTNICDMGLGLDLSAHVCDKNKLDTLVSIGDKEDCAGRILSDFQEQNPLLDDLARSDILDKDTMLIDSDKFNSVEESLGQEDDSISKQEKKKESHWTDNEITFNQSLQSSLQSKEKVNWESLSIISRQSGDFDTEKDVDFPEFNLLTFQVDSNEGLNPIGVLPQIDCKEIPETSVVSLLETTNELENCNVVGTSITPVTINSSQISIPETSDVPVISIPDISSVADSSSVQDLSMPEMSIPEAPVVPKIQISESNKEICSDNLITNGNFPCNSIDHINNDETSLLNTTLSINVDALGKSSDFTDSDNQVKNSSFCKSDQLQHVPTKMNTKNPVLMSNPRSVLRNVLTKTSHSKRLLSQGTSDCTSRPILKTVSNQSEVSTTLVKCEQDSSKSGLPKKPAPSMAIIAISTDKSKNTTEIVINTSHGEQKFKGKTSDLMKATSSLWTKLDNRVLKTKLDTLNISGIDKASVVSPVDPFELGKETEQTDQESSEVNGDPSERMDEPSDGPDEQPITEALSELGIESNCFLSITTLTGQKLWACPTSNCEKLFPRLSMLKVHILTHFGVRPYRCDFSECHWTFYTYFKLKRHKETHLKRKAFMCPVVNCGRRFTTVYNLNTHQKLHARPAEMICPVESCKARFQTKRSMERHMKEHDSHHAPYKCSFEGCGKHYYSSNSLNSHARSHQHKEEEVKCQWEGCGKLFDKPCRLKAHMRTHTGDKPYPCTFVDCGWAFSSASKLKRHQHKHTNERKFRCALVNCGKSFMRSEHLKEHTLTHIGERTFRCPVENCDVKFSAKSSLYVHLKKHNTTKVTPSAKVAYHCPIEQCSRSYICKSSLRHHMLRCHTPVLACDSSQLDYIALLTGDDDLGILEGVQFAGDLPSATNGGINMLNAVNLLAPNTILPNCAEGMSTIVPEYINTDFQLPHVLTSQLGAGNIITHVVLSPSDPQTSSVLMSMPVPSTSAPPSEVNHVDSETMTEQLEDSSCSEMPLVEIPDDPTCRSARTSYTYDDIVQERERKSGAMFIGPTLVQSSDTTGLRIPTDVVLGTSMLGNTQDMTHNLLLQDDHHDHHTVYQEDPGTGEFHVLLLDPGGSSQQEFAESTINLRDLE